MDRSELERLVAGFSLVRACDRIASGALRISTPFVYPDGSFIDVFIEAPTDFFSGIIISDLGQTADFLRHLNLPPWGTKKRQQVVSDICRVLEVEMKAGKIQTAIGEDAERLSRAVLDDRDRQVITQAILRVAQACLRISDLSLTKNFSTANVYRDEFEEFISANEFPFEGDVLLPGIYGKDLRFDFRVSSGHVPSLVQTLSTGHASVAQHMAQGAFAKWHDLGLTHRNQHRLLTVFDSSVNVFRDDDLDRLREYSEVYPYPAEADQLADVLANGVRITAS